MIFENIVYNSIVSDKQHDMIFRQASILFPSFL
jgi:hypothetical protein